MAAPINYQIHMAQLDAELSEPDIDSEPNPLDAFVAKRAFAVAGAAPGLAAFASLTKTPYKPPTDVAACNPWIEYAKVHSQQIENKVDEELNVADPLELLKRAGESTRRANVTAFIKRQLAIGETIESLSDYAAKHDAETAALIREIGATL